MDASSSNDCLSRLLINVSYNPCSFHPHPMDPTCLLDGPHFRDALETCPVHSLHLKQSLQGFFPLCLKGCSKYDGGIKNKSTSVLGFSQSGGLYLNIDTLGVCSLQSHVLCQVLFRSTTLQFSLLCRKYYSWWFVDEKY